MERGWENTPSGEGSNAIGEQGRQGLFEEHGLLVGHERELGAELFEEEVDKVGHEGWMGALWVLWVEEVYAASSVVLVVVVVDRA